MSLPESVPFPSTGMTEEDVEEFIGELAAQGPEGADRRRHKRLPYRQMAVLVLPDGPEEDSSILVLTNNISKGGLAFKHSSELEPGTLCKVKIMLPTGGLAICKGKVVRCRKLEGGGYEVGLQFAQLLDLTLMTPRGEPISLGRKLRRAAWAILRR
jgi:hypothetical protein